MWSAISAMYCFCVLLHRSGAVTARQEHQPVIIRNIVLIVQEGQLPVAADAGALHLQQKDSVLGILRKALQIVPHKLKPRLAFVPMDALDIDIHLVERHRFACQVLSIGLGGPVVVVVPLLTVIFQNEFPGFHAFFGITLIWCFYHQKIPCGAGLMQRILEHADENRAPRHIAGKVQDDRIFQLHLFQHISLKSCRVGGASPPQLFCHHASSPSPI